jgi:c-di-GMP-binding flagellar brake protein YcgR
MEAERRAEGAATHQPERRSSRRLPVDEASVVLLLSHGLPMECRVQDLSLEGCRICTQERFTAGSRARVEVSFKINGIAFRFCGATQWTDGRNVVGIQFVDVVPRRREALAEVLAELEAAEAAKAAKQAAREETERQAQEQFAREAADRLAGLQKEAWRSAEPAHLRQGEMYPEAQRQAEEHPPLKPARRERRAESRHEVDTSAVIDLIKIGSKLRGRILDISAGGCRIRTDERFPVGIYTRVETEFRVEGLPFRLGGVIQAIHDRERHVVGIRFLDMSQRKREQVEQLIAEIEEMRARRDLAQSKALGK